MGSWLPVTSAEVLLRGFCGGYTKQNYMKIFIFRNFNTYYGRSVVSGLETFSPNPGGSYSRHVSGASTKFGRAYKHYTKIKGQFLVAYMTRAAWCWLCQHREPSRISGGQ